jgi:predicted O-methyltransferase YrrM
MSTKRTPIDHRLDEYLLDNFSADDDFLIRLKQEAVQRKIPDIFISADQARIIQGLLLATGAKNVLEIGTLGAYSAICMARVLPPDGKVITIENNRLHYTFSLEKIKEAGLEDKIEVHYCYAKEFFENYKPDYELDFAFMDADKQNLKNYLNYCAQLLRKGGIFAVDNAFALGCLMEDNPDLDEKHKHRLRDIEVTREFNMYFRSRADFFVSLLTVGDGLIMGVKL